MATERKPDEWREAQGGFRGSHLLLAGAALLACGAVAGLAAGAGPAGSPTLAMAGWLAYLLGLAVTGLGFGWSGVAGILPRAALAVAFLHVVHSGFLLYVLYSRQQPPLSPSTLTVGRYLALLIFAVMARQPLGLLPSAGLAAAAALGLARTLVRVFAPAADGGKLIDGIVLLAVGAAIAITARRLRGLEDAWAREHRPARRSDFSEFNNPEHTWNKLDEPR